MVRTGLEPVLPGIQIGAINTIPHSPILASTIPPPDQFWVTKENRTPIYRTTIYRVNRYTIATMYKPNNVGLRCTLFNPLSHPSLLKSCQYRIPHLSFCTLGRNWTFFSFLSGMCANHSTTRAILPHFTGLMDRLPYGSGGFLLFQDSALPGGLEPP